nr:M42 family metallopeptidase [Bhargavaea ginsengi]
MKIPFELEQSLEILEKLVNTPSPSGYTADVMKLAASYLAESGAELTKTNKGAVIATFRGEDDSKSRLITAHVDTLGAIVKEIKPSGRLKLDKIGGFNWNAAEGEYCTVHTADGRKIRGTILMHQTTVHVYRDSGKAERSSDNIEVRLDERTGSADATRALGIEVGDFVSFDPRFERSGGYIKSRHLDDKASTALLLELAARLKETSEKLPHTLHLYISNNEEIGFGGNASVPDGTVEYIAFDMGAIGDGQSSDEYTVSICVKDSSGPYHYGLTRHLADLCKNDGIPHKLDIYPYYGSDASAAIRAGFDVRHALFGPGIESSHALERTHTDSLEAAARLLRAYILSPLAED